jgi:hypothetical protein
MAGIRFLTMIEGVNNALASATPQDLTLAPCLMLTGWLLARLLRRYIARFTGDALHMRLLQFCLPLLAPVAKKGFVRQWILHALALGLLVSPVLINLVVRLLANKNGGWLPPPVGNIQWIYQIELFFNSEIPFYTVLRWIARLA